MSSDSPAPARFEPPASEEGTPFWDATREHRLVLPWCTACGQPHWFPRAACPHCLSAALEWRPASGRGEVYAASVMHRAALPVLEGRVPYVVALVQLDEGVRMMSNVVDCNADDVRVGQAVQVQWEDLSDGRAIPVFSPVA